MKNRIGFISEPIRHEIPYREHFGKWVSVTHVSGSEGGKYVDFNERDLILNPSIVIGYTGNSKRNILDKSPTNVSLDKICSVSKTSEESLRDFCELAFKREQENSKNKK